MCESQNTPNSQVYLKNQCDFSVTTIKDYKRNKTNYFNSHVLFKVASNYISFFYYYCYCLVFSCTARPRL